MSASVILSVVLRANRSMSFSVSRGGRVLSKKASKSISLSFCFYATAVASVLAHCSGD